jgi:hypothetical protein
MTQRNMELWADAQKTFLRAAGLEPNRSPRKDDDDAPDGGSGGERS